LLELQAIAKENRLKAAVDKALKDYFKEIDDPMIGWTDTIKKIEETFMRNLAPGLKAAVEEAARFAKYQDEIKDNFQIIKEKHGEAAYNTAITFAFKQYKDTNKFFEKFKKVREKHNLDVVKQEGDKYDKMIEKARQYKDKALEMLRSAGEEQKAYLISQGYSEKAINTLFVDQVKLFEKQKSGAKIKEAEKTAKKAKTLAEKEHRELVSNTKDQMKAYEQLYEDSYRQREDYYEKAIALNEKLANIETVELIEKGVPMVDALAWRADRLKEYSKELEGTFGSWEDMSERTADAIEDNFSSFFKDFFRGELNSASDYFQAFCNSLLDSFSDMLGEMMRQMLFGDKSAGMQGLFPFLFSGAKGLFGTSATAGTLGGLTEFQTAGALFHGGGIVGKDMVASRAVPASLFATAPRLHRGLNIDEFPAILQRGETVIPKGGDNTIRDEARIEQVSGDTYNININAVDAKSFSDLAHRNAPVLLSSVNKALQNNPSARHGMKRMIT